MTVPAGQMCEFDCGRKALFLCHTAVEFSEDRKSVRYLYTCCQCGSDLRGGIFDVLAKQVDEANRS